MSTTTEIMTDMDRGADVGGAPAGRARPGHPDRPVGYGGLWAVAPREFGYLLLAFPLATFAFGVSLTLFNVGVGTIVTFFIGLLVLIGGLYVARGFGTLELTMLGWMKLPPIDRPDWRDDRARRGFFPWIGAVIGNGHYWLHLLWAALVNFVVSTVTFVIAITWVSVALGGVSYWFWERFPPNRSGGVFPAHWLLTHLGLLPEGADPQTTDNIAFLVLGLIFLATLPFVLRGLTWARWGVARGMLGAFRSDALRRQVSDLSASRTAAVAAEGTALRRLERDIHDGPQQRLVRMQMDLASADRQLDADPATARRLIREALAQSREALDELRALSRGFAPPILLDRGLVPALESLAVRGVVPTRVESTIPAGTELPAEIERNAYFIAAEAVTNAGKHAQATVVTIALALRRIPETDQTWLDVTVSDDGFGGAEVVPGHGLGNLHERVQGLGGVLEITSPVGGPTAVAAHLPVNEASV